MPHLPALLSDPIKLADWLELSALEAGDKNASSGDLENALQLAENEVDEALIIEVMNEIEQRQDAARDAYPFLLEHSRVLQAKDSWADHTGYIFCLCLSYFGWRPQRRARINPWLLFEDLSCVAAKQFIQGEVFKFGSRYRSRISAFRGAVDELCSNIGEGISFRPQRTFNRQDDKVDLVAWKEFEDQRPSKLIMFGQCAAGNNWPDKITELQPDAFWEQWMSDPKTSPLLRSFYIPHRIPDDQWQMYARRAGILFDRCRIAFWAWQNNQVIVADPRYMNWCISVFPTLR